jgi:DNA polymerase
MSDERAPARELRDRLIWLRTLGVEEIPGSASERSAAATIDAAAGPERAHDGVAAGEGAPPGVTQPDLFGGEKAAGGDAPGASGRRRRRGAAAGSRTSPLASARAPDAPDAAAGLSLIRADLGDCQRCRLHEKRTNVVFGVGDPNARLMFIGEGPGADEDRQGEPFVGRAGQLLTRIIEAMGLRREQVYIANVVKCRPPENRTPLPEEVITCSPFLFQQVATIRPRVIVCLGTPAAQTVLATRETITRMRGTFREVGGIRIMPTFHPAYLLRNPAAKREVWEDMKNVMDCLKSEE